MIKITRDTAIRQGNGHIFLWVSGDKGKGSREINYLENNV